MRRAHDVLYSASAPSSRRRRPIDRVGLDQIFLMRRRRVDALVDRRDRARRHAGAAVDALFRMDVQHRRGCELRLVLARVDAVHRADVHAGGVFGFDAGVGDDEWHARESPSKALFGSPPAAAPAQSRRIIP